MINGCVSKEIEKRRTQLPVYYKLTSPLTPLLIGNAVNLISEIKKALTLSPSPKGEGSKAERKSNVSIPFSLGEKG